MYLERSPERSRSVPFRACFVLNGIRLGAASPQDRCFRSREANPSRRAQLRDGHVKSEAAVPVVHCRHYEPGSRLSRPAPSSRACDIRLSRRQMKEGGPPITGSCAFRVAARTRRRSDVDRRPDIRL